jgi:hypothetical protein
MQWSQLNILLPSIAALCSYDSQAGTCPDGSLLKLVALSREKSASLALANPAQSRIEIGLWRLQRTTVSNPELANE